MRPRGSPEKAANRLAASSVASFGWKAGGSRRSEGLLIILAWLGPAKAWSSTASSAHSPGRSCRPRRALGLLEQGSGFAEACVWADAIRSDPAYDWAKPHHYVNMPAGAAAIDLARDCPSELGCIIRAIAMHIGTLRHPNASAADKAQALKFLAHFVGDMHQPLHVGRAEDRGGTAIEVRFLGEETSLHAVWDGRLIAQMESDWRALAERLHASILNAERVTWQRWDVHNWAAESQRLAIMRAYAKPEGAWILGRDDVAQNAPEVAEQLKKGGRAARLDLEGCSWPGSRGGERSVRVPEQLQGTGESL
jgi:S1/P1 Nuclease